MTIRKPKASVAIDACESKTSTTKKRIRDKPSTVAYSENSIRKLKVSEAIIPVMREYDKFSLKVLSEKSLSNHSYGSLNETFEKNINFNFQNSYTASSSIESRSKKVSVAAAPIFKSISPIKRVKIINKEKTKSIVPKPRESPKELINNEIFKSSDNQIFEESQNIEVIEESQNDQLIVESQPNEISQKSQELFEDIDDVQLSSFDFETESTKSPSFSEFILDKKPAVAVERINNTVGTSNDLRKDRLAKINAKEHITKQSQIDNVFRLPVDIDASQNVESQDLKKAKVHIEKSPVAKDTCLSVSESCGQQSKLCDISKAYLHSQDSSLISSPMEQEKMKSTCNLPGRVSFIVPNSVSKKSKIDKPLDNKINTPISNTDELDQATYKDNTQTSDEEFVHERQFFKSSFYERRCQEIQRFSTFVTEKSIPKNADAPLKKTSKKPRKPKNSPKSKKTQKPRVKKKPKETIEEISTQLSKNSEKENLDNITIENSEMDKFCQPIEKARGGSNNSDDDMFSFTPQFIQKRKLKTLKTKSKSKAKPSRSSNFSTVYDINSDWSSPLPMKRSLMSFKSSRKSTNLGDEVIPKAASLNEIIINFESDIGRLKTIQQAMNFQLGQFKSLLSKHNLL